MRTQSLLAELKRLRTHLASVFPLLSRELIEMASRRRTYVLRVLYAGVLYGFTAWVFWHEMGSWTGQTFTFLGRGRELFEALAWVQFCGIYLFLPAMTSGVLTIEKERDTLSILLLTRLGPWSILLGKLCSRLVPMASFVLLSLPLMAVAYSLGGVNDGEIAGLAWTLSVTALQVGSLSIACSAWCRTTAAAFVWTYLAGAVLFLGPAFVLRDSSYLLGLREFLREYCEVNGLAGSGNFDLNDVNFLLFGPWVCLHSSAKDLPLDVIFGRTVPMLMFSVACLFFARMIFWRRAFLQPSNMLLKLFRSLDTLFHRLNQNRVTRGIVLTKNSAALPLYEPIRWRETTKRSLGSARYLVRLLLVMEIPVLFVMLIPNYSGPGNNTGPQYVIAWAIWIIVALLLTIQSTGLIGSERSRQTLDVLLTTPLTSTMIVREKFAGIWRLTAILLIPLATIYTYQLFWVSWGNTPVGLQSYLFVRGILAMAIYPMLISWLGFHLGLRCRSQTQAVLSTLGWITGFCIVPIIISTYLGAGEGTLLYEIRWLSPAAALSINVDSDFYTLYASPFVLRRNPSTWFGMLGHFVLAGSAMVLLWSFCTRRFSRHVNRNDGQQFDDHRIDRLVSMRETLERKGILRASVDDQ